MTDPVKSADNLHASSSPAPGAQALPPAKVMTGMQVYGRLLLYVRPYIGVFFICVLGYIIYAASQAAVAPWLGWTIDQVEARSSEGRILSPILCVLIVVVRGIGGFMGGY